MTGGLAKTTDDAEAVEGANSAAADGTAISYEQIEGFLTLLERQRFALAPRERLRVHQLFAALAAHRRPARVDDDTRAMLASLLSRNEGEQVRFYALFDDWFRGAAIAPPVEQPEQPQSIATTIAGMFRNAGQRVVRTLSRNIVLASIVVALLAVAAVVSMSIVPRGTGSVAIGAAKNPSAENSQSKASGAASVRRQVAPVSPEASKSGLVEALARDLVDRMNGPAPTLRELVTAGWPNEVYKVKLVDRSILVDTATLARLSAMPADVPLWLSSSPAARDGERLIGAATVLAGNAATPSAARRALIEAVSARRSWPLERELLLPLAVDSHERLVEMARVLRAEPLFERWEAGRLTGRRLLERLYSPWQWQWPEFNPDLEALLRHHHYGWFGAMHGHDAAEIERVLRYDDSVERILALAVRAADGSAAITHQSDSWLPRADPRTTVKAASWLPWALASLPLLVAVFALLNRYQNRVSFLLNKVPDAPPLLFDLVVEAPRRVAADVARLHKVAHALQTRMATLGTRIDPRRSVFATLRRGGLFTPVRAYVRRTPDYIVLIETMGPDDQEAERVGLLVDRLRNLDVHVEQYYMYDGSSRCFRQHGENGIDLDELAARYPEHRLVIIGSGHGFFDPFTLQPRPWTDALKLWQRRAMLTPKPLRGWGSHEFALAKALELPLGRATIEGLFGLFELLGLDGADGRPMFKVYDVRGSVDRDVPEVVTRDSDRWMAPIEPDDRQWQALESALRGWLGEQGWRWLASLAIYPALQWDLTLYLGVSLKDRDGNPLYDERLAARLTLLPWLREGFMPTWLRRRLIGTLTKAERQEAVDRLWDVLEGNGRSAEVDDRMRLRLAREREAQRGLSLDARQPYRDSVFVETMAHERIPDLAFRLRFLPDNSPLAKWLRQFMWPEIRATVAALTLAIALFLLAPGPSTGTLSADAYLVPLALCLFALAGTQLARVLAAPYPGRRFVYAALDDRPQHIGIRTLFYLLIISVITLSLPIGLGNALKTANLQLPGFADISTGLFLGGVLLIAAGIMLFRATYRWSSGVESVLFVGGAAWMIFVLGFTAQNSVVNPLWATYDKPEFFILFSSALLLMVSLAYGSFQRDRIKPFELWAVWLSTTVSVIVLGFACLILLFPSLKDAPKILLAPLLIASCFVVFGGLLGIAKLRRDALLPAEVAAYTPFAALCTWTTAAGLLGLSEVQVPWFTGPTAVPLFALLLVSPIVAASAFGALLVAGLNKWIEWWETVVYWVLLIAATVGTTIGLANALSFSPSALPRAILAASAPFVAALWFMPKARLPGRQWWTLSLMWLFYAMVCGGLAVAFGLAVVEGLRLDLPNLNVWGPRIAFLLPLVTLAVASRALTFEGVDNAPIASTLYRVLLAGCAAASIGGVCWWLLTSTSPPQLSQQLALQVSFLLGIMVFSSLWRWHGRALSAMATPRASHLFWYLMIIVGTAGLAFLYAMAGWTGPVSGIPAYVLIVVALVLNGRVHLPRLGWTWHNLFAVQMAAGLAIAVQGSLQWQFGTAAPLVIAPVTGILALCLSTYFLAKRGAGLVELIITFTIVAAALGGIVYSQALLVSLLLPDLSRTLPANTALAVVVLLGFAWGYYGWFRQRRPDRFGRLARA